MTKPSLLSGMQPSASSLHLGNYLGALRQWVELQDSHQAFYVIVDLHAITVPQDPIELRENTRRTAAQYLAAGIDPEKSSLFVQSHVPEHSQLAWVLNCITGFGEASRMTQFKDKSQKSGADNSSVGLFTYPILQAADILLYRPAVVPVGEDQRQHLELTRDLAIRFNSRYRSVLRVPEAKILKETAKIYDLQQPSAKMSKSAADPKGVLNILDSPAEIAKKVKSAVTDTDGEMRFDRESKPGLANLIGIYAAVSGEATDSVVSRFNGKGYGQLKQDLADLLVETLAPLRDRCTELLSDSGELDRILQAGAEKARSVASETLKDVYECVGFLPPRH